jgi:hypothetical protein
VNKTDFFNGLSAQIAEPIYLTDKTDEVAEEINNNCWALSPPDDIVSQTTTIDFLEFIQKVKDSYKNQLDQSQLDIDLIFYLWVDAMAGQIRFNFINSNHNQLPFGCKLKFTERPEEIIMQYLTSTHREGIPWKEFYPVETTEQIVEAERVEKELKDDYSLTVYREIIKKRSDR